MKPFNDPGNGNLIPKYNRLAKEPSLKTRTFAHSGVYEFRKYGEEDQVSGQSPTSHAPLSQVLTYYCALAPSLHQGAWMWSDTASSERRSPGDIVKIHNPHAFNFASPTSTRG